MLYLNSDTLHLNQLASAISWGYVVCVIREQFSEFDRYRLEIALRNKPLQALQIEGIPGTSGAVEVINRKLLLKCLNEQGLPETVLDCLVKNKNYDRHHLRGTDAHTVCRLAYHLPVIEPGKLHLPTKFLELPEEDQCPNCRNRIDPSYLPVWRFREPKIIVQEPFRPRRLPG